MHLIMDGLSLNLALMTDEGKMRAFLAELVSLAGMTPYGEANIQGYPWPGSKDASALTAFQPLGESGLVVHTFPEKHYVFIDLYSCSEFDEDEVEQYIADSFGHGKWRVIILERGVDPETGDVIPAALTEQHDIWF